DVVRSGVLVLGVLLEHHRHRAITGHDIVDQAQRTRQRRRQWHQGHREDDRATQRQQWQDQLLILVCPVSDGRLGSLIFCSLGWGAFGIRLLCIQIRLLLVFHLRGLLFRVLCVVQFVLSHYLLSPSSAVDRPTWRTSTVRGRRRGNETRSSPLS